MLVLISSGEFAVIISGIEPIGGNPDTLTVGQPRSYSFCIDKCMYVCLLGGGGLVDR